MHGYAASMFRRPFLLMSCLIAACKGGTTDPPAKTGNDSGSTADTDTDTDLDTDTDADTDLDTDTGEPPPPVVSGQLDLTALGALPANLRVALVPIFFGEGPRLGTAVATATPDASGAFSLQPPESPPPLSDRYQVGEFQPLDVSGATYAILAYEAAGPEAPWADGDPLHGAALSALLIWLDDTAPDQGWPSGWSLVDAGLAGTYGNNRCLLDTQVPLQWAVETGYPVFSATDMLVDLTPMGAPRALDLVASVADGTPARIAALPYREVFEGEEGVPPAFDGSLEDGLTAMLDGAPPAESQLNPSAELVYSLFVPLAYDDTDASGNWSEGDAADGTTLCSETGDRLLIRHTVAPSSWSGLKLLDCQGGLGGWTAVRRADSGTWSSRASSTELETLRVDPALCSW